MFSRAGLKARKAAQGGVGRGILSLLQAYTRRYELHHVWKPMFSKGHSEEVTYVLTIVTL